MRRCLKLLAIIPAIFLSFVLAFSLTSGAPPWSGVLEQKLTTALGDHGLAKELLRMASGDVVSIQNFGAIPNDTVDDTVAFNLAVESLGGRGIIELGSGTYYFAGAKLTPGIQVRGNGASHNPNDAGRSTTIVKLPTTATAGTPCFRLDASCPNSFDGGGFFDIEFDGQGFSGAAAVPSAPSSTVEVLKRRAIDFRYSTLYEVSAVNQTTEVLTTTAAHGFTTGQAVGAAIGPGGAVPTGLNTVPHTNIYYARAITATTCSLHTSAAGAAANTGAVDLSSAGTAPFYISRTVTGIDHFYMDRCSFHHFDEAVRGSSSYDHCSAVGSAWRYNWTGFQGQEHPKFEECEFSHNFIGMTGRYNDLLLGDTNHFTYNFYGISPYGTDAGTNSYLFNTTSSYIVNNSTISAGFYKNVVGITISDNCTIMPGTLVVGESSDISPWDYSESIGVRIQGQYNVVSGTYGYGTSDTSFGRCAIMVDKNGNTGAVNPGNVIIGARFFLSAGTAIVVGNSNVATPLFGTGNTGAINRLNVINCMASLLGQRFFYFVPSSGLADYCTFADNNIYLITGGSSPIDADDGIIEGMFRSGCEFRGNRIYRISGDCGSAIKNNPGVATNVRYESNRFDGTFSVAALDYSVGTPTGCVWHNNLGYVTENKGEVTLNNTTAVTVAHGLARTPLISDVQLTPQAEVGAEFWVSAVDATNITVDADNTTSAKLNWSVKISP